MKKHLLSFILMAMGVGMANAAEPVKGILCSYFGHEAFFPLSESPSVKYVDKAGEQNAVVLVGGAEKMAVALIDGGKLAVSYDNRALSEYAVSAKITASGQPDTSGDQSLKAAEGNDGDVILTLPAATIGGYEMAEQTVKVKFDAEGNISMVDGQTIDFTGTQDVVVTVTSVAGTLADGKLNVTIEGEGSNGIDVTFAYTSAASHEHDYATSWSSDETNHWHACTGEGECDAPKSGEAAHSYGEVATETAYYTCSVCQYENATRKAEYEAAVKAADDQAAADAVVTKINAIGTVAYTEASKALIDTAREAYDALTDDQKTLVTAEQLNVLTDAEAEYANLKAAAEKAAADQAAAAAVVEKINAIGTVEYTEASKALIDEAREAYDALTDDQKALITAEQLQVLTDAETAYEDLKAAAEEAAKYATLTYNVADQGGLGVNVKKGEVILNVTAEECWTVATLTVNEEDKIADLAEGKLKFDMQDDATVAVTYKWADEENLYTESDITTGIITTKADVKAYTKDGSIYVESNGAAITLYTINGTKIAQKTPAMKTAIFTVPAGAYIVKVGSEGIKLVVE